MIKNIGNIFPNNPVDRMIIESYANQKGVKFPKQYTELISISDGIYPELSSFDYIDTAGNLTINTIVFGGYLNTPFISGCQFPEGDDDYDGKIIPFGSTPGGDFICFDYRFPWIIDQPKIVLVLHDDFYDYGTNEGKRVVLYLADNFLNFINSLHELIDY